MNARVSCDTVRTLTREVAIAAIVAFATLQLFDFVFPFLVGDLLSDYRTLTALTSILIVWLFVEFWYPGLSESEQVDES